jgi:hypothetical protein
MTLAPRTRKQVRPQVIQDGHIPAPIGGINTVDAGSDMPSKDCIYLYNMIAAEYGLRSRLGFAEWCTGLTGAGNNSVRTTIPFSGSHKNGSTDRMFASTEAGIWDVTTPTVTPSKLVTFSTQTDDAGFGISCVASTPGGRFLLFTDEENGYYVWSESGASWTHVASGVTQLWQPQTFYTVGNQVVNGGNVYVVASVTTGTSASSGGPTGTGTGITDAGVVWNYVSAAPTHAIGPSLADQQAGFAANPANFAFVVVWKSRVWFVEKDTSRGWYLDVNSIFGTATSFDFGSRMRAGGPLSGLYNWSYDGGAGMDTLLVGVSTSGDIVIYQGTDPTSASTFGIVGTWSVGAVPYGRRIATDYGGDILVLSSLGVIPLSKLVIGDPIVDRTQYATAKIANLFSRLASSARTLQGWSLHIHPEDNALLICVPSANGQPTTQLAMSFATRGWSQYRDLPMLSAGSWNGKLYFGTTDGRVCQNTGYLDNVTLADPNAWSSVQWSLLTAYQNLENSRSKQVQTIRPSITSQTPNPIVSATAKYGFDLSEPPPPAGATAGIIPGTWDGATWDSTLWDGDFVSNQPLSGGVGMGRDVAIAIRGSAISRTTLVGIDVQYTQGGLL